MTLSGAQKSGLLAGRVALVSGGAQGIGRAIVERLHAAGFDICFTFRSSKAEADELARAVN